MSKDAGDILGSVLALISFAAGMGWSCGFDLCERRFHREAIDRGLALYDPITGKWRWKEPGE